MLILDSAYSVVRVFVQQMHRVSYAQRSSLICVTTPIAIIVVVGVAKERRIFFGSVARFVITVARHVTTAVVVRPGHVVMILTPSRACAIRIVVLSFAAVSFRRFGASIFFLQRIPKLNIIVV